MITGGYVYILASRKQGTLYIGVTSDIIKRLSEHRQNLTPGFTTEYNVKRLMWLERHEEIIAAIRREKQIKKWNRDWKIRLIEAHNPDWDDLAISMFGFAPLPFARGAGDGPRLRGGDGYSWATAQAGSAPRRRHRGRRWRHGQAGHARTAPG